MTRYLNGYLVFLNLHRDSTVFTRFGRPLVRRSTSIAFQSRNIASEINLVHTQRVGKRRKAFNRKRTFLTEGNAKKSLFTWELFVLC
uniref:Uncharacterized protein n=1 Tax=Heterorhabditis bacteriophora TaxID=37862 RepID=A0A1I7X708_HETBA